MYVLSVFSRMDEGESDVLYNIGKAGGRQKLKY